MARCSPWVAAPRASCTSRTGRPRRSPPPGIARCSAPHSRHRASACRRSSGPSPPARPSASTRRSASTTWSRVCWCGRWWPECWPMVSASPSAAGSKAPSRRTAWAPTRRRAGPSRWRSARGCSLGWSGCTPRTSRPRSLWPRTWSGSSRPPRRPPRPARCSSLWRGWCCATAWRAPVCGQLPAGTARWESRLPAPGRRRRTAARMARRAARRPALDWLRRASSSLSAAGWVRRT
mmetsp:Transcript_22419/g.72466  ORF Transcript_22419/g.72466 Transcript_22419/m.72466 type:complete len:235 (+) Transcript_22419:840-1544(+)